MEELLTLDEVAIRLKYTPQTVKGLIKSGQLKGRKLGWQWRVKAEDLQAFIEGNSKEEIDNA